VFLVPQLLVTLSKRWSLPYLTLLFALVPNSIELLYFDQKTMLLKESPALPF